MNYITLADETVLGIVNMVRELASLSDSEMQIKFQDNLEFINPKPASKNIESQDVFLANLDKYLEGESPATQIKFYQTIMYITARLTT
mgnify:CR=1 FL=1|jgi:hypothetical protein